MTRTLAICDLSDWRAGGKRKEDFVAKMGEALQDIGFFALTGHGIDVQSIKKSYSVSEEFFHLPQEEKTVMKTQSCFDKEDTHLMAWNTLKITLHLI